ncbi:MAG: hypothetical protein R3F39_17950 [Myxococcota bacterium]
MRACWQLLMGAVAACLAVGCATGRPVAEGPDEGAVLEIVNRLPGAERVWVRGRAEGVVAGGSRLRVRWLAPGPADVEITPMVDAGLGGEPTMREVVELVWGQRHVLEIPGPEASPAELGSLLVDNQLAGPVTLSLDDRPLGTVLPGDTARYRDIPSGTHTVRARENESGLAVEESILIAPDAEVAWSAVAPRGGVTVIHDGDEPIAVSVDAREVGRVEPGERIELDQLLAGSHLLRLRGVQSGRTEDRRIQVVAGERVETRVTAPRSEIEVVNRTKERVILSVTSTDSKDAVGDVPTAPRVEVELAPGQSHLLSDREPGEVVLEARGEPSGLPYREAMRLPAGQRVRWEIQSIRASIRLENGAGRPLWVRVENTGRQETLADGATKMLDGLPVEPIRLLVVDRDRSLVLRRTVEPGEDRTASWKITAPTGSLAVDNRSDEAVVVYADARRVGRVEARAQVVLTGVPAGHRLLEAVGARSSHVTRGERDIAEDEAAAWTVEDPLASLVVTNETGETLLTEGVLAVDEASIAQGGRVLLRIPAGTQDLRLVGVESNVARSHRVTAGPGEVLEWRVLPAVGSLLVTNALDEAMAVSVDGVDFGRVAPRGRLSIPELRPGRRKLRAEGASGARVLSEERMIPPDGEAHWALERQTSRLLIFNESSEALEVTLNGRPYGRVEARSRQGFAKIPTGSQELVLTATRAGWRDTRRLDLAEGATATIRVQPPGAVLVLANRSGEAQRITIDGAQIAEIALDGVSEPLPIEAGRRRVVSEGAKTGSVRVWRVDVSASQTVHLEVPPSRARLVVVNRGASNLFVRVDGTRVGEVAPGENLIVDDLAVGEFDLEAVGPDGSVGYRERRVLEPGATATWLLPAPPTPAETAAP